MDLIQTIDELRRRRDEVSQAIHALERLQESALSIKRRGRTKRTVYGNSETVDANGFDGAQRREAPIVRRAGSAVA